MLLVLTNLSDFAADYLLSYLRDRERPYVRLNSEQLGEIAFEIAFPAGSMNLTLPGGKLDSCSVRSVLYRRSFVSPGPVGDGVAAFKLRERVHALQGVLLAMPAKWINPMAATVAAERKLHQLQLASRCGLEVPPTLVTTDPGAAASFIARHRRVVVKPISYGFVRDGAGDHAAFAERLADIGPDDAPAITGTPTLLQAEVERGLDYRITVVGRQMFPACVRFRPEQHVDWRVPGAHPTYEAADIPPGLRDAISRLMAALDLRYGAFDFIRSAAGEWVFLEVNPAGEWAWIEESTGAPIRAAFEELFYE